MEHTRNNIAKAGLALCLGAGVAISNLGCAQAAVGVLSYTVQKIDRDRREQRVRGEINMLRQEVNQLRQQQNGQTYSPSPQTSSRGIRVDWYIDPETRLVYKDKASCDAAKARARQNDGHLPPASEDYLKYSGH